jgi:hypothetical protein
VIIDKKEKLAATVSPKKLARAVFRTRDHYAEMIERDGLFDPDELVTHIASGADARTQSPDERGAPAADARAPAKAQFGLGETRTS